MIHGDIDLTENLDFYRDKKEKDYINTRNFRHSRLDLDTDEVPDVISGGFSWQLSYTNSNTSRWNEYPIQIINSPEETTVFSPSTNNVIRYNTNNIQSTVSWNSNSITWHQLSNYDSWHFLDYTNYDEYNTIRDMTSYINYKTIPKKSSTCEKLFGKKRSKVYYNDSVLSEFKAKPTKVYNNSKLFYEHHNHHYYDGWNERRHYYMSLVYHDGLSMLHDLFGFKEKSSRDRHWHYSSIPWLEDFADRHYRLFEDYMHELKGKEVDNNKYLTDYSWLRIY